MIIFINWQQQEDGQIKMVNLQTWQEIVNEKNDLPNDCCRISKMVWSQNGQILVVSTEKGCLFGFQTSIPTLTAAYSSMIAQQQSFTEIQIYSTQEQSLNEISNVTLENEPVQITMSMQYFTAGLNNMVFYDKYLELKNKKAFKPAIQVMKMYYLGYVNQILLNDDSVALLSNNVCIFHKIEQTGEALSLTTGSLKCFTMSRNVMDQPLISHSYLKSYKRSEDTNEGHFRYFLQNLALFKFSNAHKAVLNLKNFKLFDTFGRKCLENLEFDVAQKEFQAANNISMVMMIQSFKNETEKNLLFTYLSNDFRLT